MSSTPREWTVLSMMEWGTDYFSKRSIPDPRHSIEWLLAYILDVKRLDLYLKFDRPLSPDELDKLRPLVKRRAEHEPLQYILGFTEFMNARIRVSPKVLIPRIETEQLVEMILNRFPDKDEVRNVLDVGTGSGCIPVALKMERPHWNVTAIDLSEEALELARQNAEENSTDISFRAGDILEWETMDFETAFDIVVSNPPYVFTEEKERLEKQVVEYEPALALFSDNLEKMYGSIIAFSGQSLVQGGQLYLELHELHSREVCELFDPVKWDAELCKDYAKKPRFIVAEKLI